MLAGNDGKLVRRITTFYKGDRFERLLVNIGSVSTYIERIPDCERERMRAWVLQLDRYVDAFVPPEFTSLSGVSDEDGDELYSARAQSAQMRDEARAADEKREAEELDRLAEEGRNRRAAHQGEPARREETPPPEPPAARSRFSRVDTGEPGPGPQAGQPAPGRTDDDSYVRQGAYSRQQANRNSDEYDRRDAAGRFAGDAEARLTYDSTRRPRSAAQPAGEQPESKPQPERMPPRRRPVPQSQSVVAEKLGLSGVLFNAVLTDGSFLRYVLERRIIFALWRKGWIGPRTRPYVADASVWQATMSELYKARLKKIDALRTRDSADSEKRAQKMAHADVLFDTASGVIQDARAAGLRLDGKLLVCDELRREQLDALRELGVSRVAVFTPMPSDTYVSTAELEAMLSFVAGREPRLLKTEDWEKLLNEAELYQEMFPI